MMEVAQNDFEMALSGELIQQAQAYFVIVIFYRSFEACHNELGLLVQTQIMKRVDECYAAMRILIASFQLTCNSISPLFRFLFSVFFSVVYVLSFYSSHKSTSSFNVSRDYAFHVKGTRTK